MARFHDGRGTLLVDGRPVAPVEIAASMQARTRGLLGRDGIEGAILLSPSQGVHTLRMRFAIDVAFLTGDLRVLKVVQMPPNRIGMVRLRARHVLETECGRMSGWGITPGRTLRIEETQG
ncbi:MAG: DUF192 domain-containing protein [Streptosporangiales bacterium]|nr:DUF192 domain-containing protein [Streptosporangiales bacterium]